MSQTKIEWTDRTWNPATGCTPISPACDHCYAARMATRLRGRFGYPAADPFAVTLHPERLDEPMRWRKPSRVFVCSMGDLFHEDVPTEFILRVLDRANSAPQHVYQVLTKRADRMFDIANLVRESGEHWPLPNIWLGVTAENQEQADKRIPVLLQIPAAVRFVSLEPLLGDVRLDRPPSGSEPLGSGIYPPWLIQGLDWVIAGGETGPGARPMHPDWVRSVRDQCQAAGVPFFFKGWGAHVPTRQCTTVLNRVPGRPITLDGVEHREFPR